MSAKLTAIPVSQNPESSLCRSQNKQIFTTLINKHLFCEILVYLCVHFNQVKGKHIYKPVWSPTVSTPVNEKKQLYNQNKASSNFWKGVEPPSPLQLDNVYIPSGFFSFFKNGIP